jgi:S1-C subfamily serine protease
VKGARAATLAAALAACPAAAGCGGGAAPPSTPAVLRVEVLHGPVERDVATGFALGGGRVATVAHVLGVDALRAQVRLRLPGARASRPARVVAVDGRDDVAILAAPWLHGGGARTEAAAAGPGEVLVLRGGRVRALPARVVRAIVARIRTAVGRRVVRRPALELRVAIGPGDSGAPVLTRRGRVAGIVFAIASDRPGIAYAVDASALSARAVH